MKRFAVWMLSVMMCVTAFAGCAGAVSYTHLDVYKRQRLCTCNVWSALLEWSMWMKCIGRGSRAFWAVASARVGFRAYGYHHLQCEGTIKTGVRCPIADPGTSDSDRNYQWTAESDCASKWSDHWIACWFLDRPQNKSLYIDFVCPVTIGLSLIHI